MRAKDGSTLREHYEAAYRATGIPPDGYLGPDCPSIARHVWEWYAELDDARGGGGFGPAPITYADIAAWSQLTGAQPAAHEVCWLRALDKAYFGSFTKKGPA